ncbi:glucokinase [Halobacteriales archaeon QS_8_69_26]|nr:MAG: glucokinase [Halobacteriales archaeon QS_8_69_26]
MSVYAGVDLGATSLRAVVAGPDGEVRGRSRRETPRGPTGIDVTEAVLSVLRAACDEAGVDPSDVRAVGIASIGPLDLAAGAVVDPANLPDSIDSIPLRGPVEQLVGGEVRLHNDAVAGVIGERYYSDRTPDDMVYLTISSGIGAGITVDGHVLTGWDGNAGEVGHYVVDPRGRRTCGCGRDGHWEAYCSGDNIPGYARLLADDDPAAAESSDLALDGELTAADVFASAEAGDPFAEHVLDQVAHWNAIGVTNVVHAFAPLVIHVGGSVALHNPEQVLDPIRERVSEMVMTNVPEINRTELGDEVVVRGALASAITGGTGARG